MGSSDLEQLTKNLSSAEGRFSQDQLVQSLLQNWSNIFWGIVGVIVVFVFGIPAIKEGRERARGAGAERFEDVQRDFEKIRFSGTPADDATVRAFEDNIKGIKDLDARSPYASFGELYLAAKDFGSGNTAGAAAKLKPFELAQLAGAGEQERLFLEQALLIKSKVLLSSDATREEAKELLRKLAVDGKIVSGEALIAYSRVFGVDDGLIRSSFGSNPANGEKVGPELEKLGWKKEG